MTPNRAAVPAPVPAPAAAPPPAGPVTTDPAPAVSAGTAPAPRRPEQAPDHADESPVAYVERIIREKDLKPKTAEKYRVAARTLEDMCGAKKMWQYTIRDAIQYKDRMQEVPARATSMRGPETRAPRGARRANARLPGDQQVPVPEHARPSMRQAREDNLRRPEPERLPVLKRETINDGYITFLRQLWDFAVGNRGAEVNIFKDVRVVSKKTARARGNRRKRRPFSIAEVNLILSMPLFTGSRSAARPNGSRATAGHRSQGAERLALPPRHHRRHAQRIRLGFRRPARRQAHQDTGR